MCLTSLFPGSGKGKNLRRKEAFNSANKWFFSPSSSSPRKKVSKSHLLRERTVCVNSEKKIFYRRLSLEADLMDLGINKIALRKDPQHSLQRTIKIPPPSPWNRTGYFFYSSFREFQSVFEHGGKTSKLGSIMYCSDVRSTCSPNVRGWLGLDCPNKSICCCCCCCLLLRGDRRGNKKRRK